MKYKVALELLEEYLKNNKSQVDDLRKEFQSKIVGNQYLDLMKQLGLNFEDKVKQNPYYDLLKEKFGDKFTDILKAKDDLLKGKEPVSKDEKSTATKNTCYAYDVSNCRYVTVEVPGYEKSEIKITLSNPGGSLLKYINVTTKQKNTLAFSKEGSTQRVAMQHEEKLVETKLKNGLLVFKIELQSAESIEINID